MIICLDPGHGGVDPGAVGPMKLQEKDVALKVCLKARELMQDSAAHIVLTRDKDETLTKIERVSRTKQADLTISVHCNSATSSLAEGIETIHGLGNVESKKLATCIQVAMWTPQHKNRGIKVSPSPEYERKLFMCYLTMPSCLVELEFISNHKQEEYLMNNIDEIAIRLVAGIRKYIDQI